MPYANGLCEASSTATGQLWAIALRSSALVMWECVLFIAAGYTVVGLWDWNRRDLPEQSITTLMPYDKYSSTFGCSGSSLLRGERLWTGDADVDFGREFDATQVITWKRGWHCRNRWDVRAWAPRTGATLRRNASILRFWCWAYAWQSCLVWLSLLSWYRSRYGHKFGLRWLISCCFAPC